LSEEAASYESKDEALSSDKTFVTFWLDAIEAASSEEKDWRKEADESVEIYRSDCDEGQAEFNILYSNIETLLPAIYNSTPSPDVRRRFGDRDPIAKSVSDIIERAISYSVDAYDFDAMMQAVLFDSALPGRGVARVRYVPYFAPGPDPSQQAEGEAPESPESPEGESQEHADGMDPPEPGEVVTYEEAVCEYVPWKHFRRGPGRVWDEVPWIAFEHFLTRDELKRLNETLGAKAQLDCSLGGKGDEDQDEQKSDVLKRGRVWEIWDKDTKEVIFIATGYADAALKRVKDPLGLQNFFPSPRPVQPILTPGKLIPVAPYKAYQPLAEELNQITARIKRLVKQLRVRGIYATSQQDIQNLATADDGELVPAQGLEMMMEGGLDKAIAWWPIEPAVKALAQLYQQRDAVKQTIYEVTGLSDILRGASHASETATAQNIKNQWGSLRIQRMQADVQRFARDLFRLKAEIIATKFSMQNLSMMTGIKLVPMEQLQAMKAQIAQAQQTGQPVPPEAEEMANAAPLEPVEQVLRSDLMRSYRIDVESDSTIRADLTRQQTQMTEFLQGTAQFITSVGPAVQAGEMPPDAAVAIYAAFARHFKLGKQVEDALAKMEEESRKPQPPKPNPEMEKAKGQMQIEQAKLQQQAQADQAKTQLDQQTAQQTAALATQKLQGEMAMAERRQQHEEQMAERRLVAEMQLKTMEVNAMLELKRQESAQTMDLARQNAQAKYSLDSEAARRKSELQGAD
jgi:uncharacterized tellurite resistance protein B-like protein